MVIGGEWLEELQPDANITSAMVRDEYLPALDAMIKWYLSDSVENDSVDVTHDMDIDTPQPDPLANPFEEIPRDFIPINWGFILLGDPGIGEQSCS